MTHDHGTMRQSPPQPLRGVSLVRRPGPRAWVAACATVLALVGAGWVATHVEARAIRIPTGVAVFLMPQVWLSVERSASNRRPWKRSTDVLAWGAVFAHLFLIYSLIFGPLHPVGGWVATAIAVAGWTSFLIARWR